ncbi:helix-turn-helix domain-containing protein [Roseibium sediminis]|uniref:helix-turn-helix domain-containing protein n=1 Tax=Roseibium sediminis TaxID=1775174 RepID=UPI00123CF8BB|nr:helix-turn-helix domain-containing protein [Roseibium sediminis]
MPAFPIPVFTACVLLFLAAKAWKDGNTPGSVLLLVLVCALQSLIISLHYHYGQTWLLAVQPITAVTIPVLTYLAFLSTSVRPLHIKPDGLHVLVPIAAAISRFVWPDLLDALIIGVFCGYGLMMLMQLRTGTDQLPLMRLADDTRPLVLWRVVAFSLIASAFSDVLIVAAVTSGAGWLHPWIISLYSSGILLVIGLLNLSDMLKSAEPRQQKVQETGPSVSSAREPLFDPAEDANILDRLEQLMKERQVYLDPDLTLRKISRQLSLPEKQISAAINRQTGENVPRYINTHRINAACELLRGGQPVTAVIYASGFNTKSNFNREFLRVKGCSPSDWLARQ